MRKTEARQHFGSVSEFAINSCYCIVVAAAAIAVEPVKDETGYTDYEERLALPLRLKLSAAFARPVSCFKRLLAELASIIPNHDLLASFVLVDVAEGAPSCLSKDCTTSAFLSKIWTAQKRSMSEFWVSRPANKSQTGFSQGTIFRFT
jgi:hypothetical protein